MKKLILIGFIIILIILIISLVCVCSRADFTNTDSGFMIYVINLDKDTERMDYIRNELKNLPFKRISAVNGRKYSNVKEISLSEGYPNLSCMKNYGECEKDGCLGQAGCYLSHLKTWKEFLNSDYQKAIVLEDDAEFNTPAYQKNLKRLVKEKYDFIWLNAVNHDIGFIEEELSFWGTQGYIINRKAAQKLYDMLKPGSAWLDSQEAKECEKCLIDWILKCAIKSGKLTSTHFSLVDQMQGFESSITGKMRVGKFSLHKREMFENNKKLFFVHIPKTGGTSISELENVESSGHGKLSKDQEYSYVFTIVRHPYDRFQSAFWHHKTLGSDDHHWKHLDADKSNIRYEFYDANDFIENLTDKGSPRYENALEEFNKFVHFRPQISFISDETGKIDERIDDIFYYTKNLGSQLKSHPMFKNEHIDFVNKTPSHNRIPLNERSKEFIRDYYHKDFDLLEFNP